VRAIEWRRGMLGVVAGFVVLAVCPVSAVAASRSDVDLLSDANVRLDGAADGDLAGWSVAGAGDVNGDGRDDVLLGAPRASHNGQLGSGSAYVVYGAASPVGVDVAALGARGFRIDGIADDDWAGWSVAAAGDVNGDGRADVLVGAPYADDNTRPDSGSAYVVYGEQAADPADVDLAALGARGLQIDGAAADDWAGFSAAGVGDVNGDGHADVLLGAPYGDHHAGAESGSAYVLYGQQAADPADVDLAALGARGLRIDGAAADDVAGRSVAGAGDVNGDGQADVLLGALFADNNARADSGSAYVIYGNGAPSCAPVGAVSSPQDTPVQLQLACTDPDSGQTLALSASAPAHGSLGPIGADRKVTYTPAAGYTGADSFTYTANDGIEDSPATTVTIEVLAPTPSPPQPPATTAPTLRLVAPGLLLVTARTFRASCRASSATLRSCRIELRRRGAPAASRPLATGRMSSATRARRLTVTLRLTAHGRRALTRALGGIRVTLDARAGQLRASRTLRILARTHHIDPPGAMFAPNRATLTTTGRRFLNRIHARARNVSAVRCTGHTATIPNGHGGAALSLRRARVACRYLRGLGLHAAFRTIGAGNRHPRADNTTEAGRALNRRVHLTITHQR
jgi:outer membrane protein OmpA-like peptidoglycan-associated protein